MYYDLPRHYAARFKGGGGWPSLRESAIIQEKFLITRKALLIDVLAFLDLHYIDLSWFLWKTGNCLCVKHFATVYDHTCC